jgi:hypothetical protein
VHGSRVAVAWEDCQEETEGPPVVTLSLDRGLEWSEPVPFDDFGGTISLALQDSFVHVVWEKMETVPGSGWDVWYRRGRIQITTDIVDVPGPTGRVLLQNYPNPFNPSTTITFEMPRGDDVTLTIYDLLGRELGRLADGIYPPGRHQVEWNADGLPGGVYYCRLQAGDVVRTKELVLMR